MKTVVFLAGAFAVALAGIAYAGPSKGNIMFPWGSAAPAQLVDNLFEQHDADDSGTISRDEAQAYFERIIAEKK